MKLLGQFLAHRDVEVVASAIEALAETGDPDVVPLLVAAHPRPAQGGDRRRRRNGRGGDDRRARERGHRSAGGRRARWLEGGLVIVESSGAHRMPPAPHSAPTLGRDPARAGGGGDLRDVCHPALPRALRGRASRDDRGERGGAGRPPQLPHRLSEPRRGDEASRGHDRRDRHVEPRRSTRSRA